MNNLPLSQVISKGIKRLVSLQERDGVFSGFSSNNEHDFSRAAVYNTTFVNAIILSALTSLPETKEIVSMKKKLITFLYAQKSDYWTWNFLLRNSPETTESSYPDDLDDTFCALVAFSLHEKKIITGDVFAYVVKILTMTETKEGGPYRTWLVDTNASQKWKDVDFAVNSNIAYFLSLHDIQLPNLQKYFDVCIKSSACTSPYYPSLYAPLYFLSRFYQGQHKEHLIKILWERKARNGSFENPLKTALAVTALLNFGVAPAKLEKSILYLLSQQKAGLWNAYGFCINQVRQGTEYFVGAPGLTTALCLETLQKYLFYLDQQRTEEIKKLRVERERQYYYNTILKNVRQHFHTYGKEISITGEKILDRILQNDKHQQIPLLPYYFFKSLRKKNKTITKNVLVKLGVANVFGWIAYTIYDDFFDEEGDLSFLPLAIISLRQLTWIFDTFTVKKKSIQKNFHTILNIIDMANAREFKNRSIKTNDVKQISVENLAEKSIGHALGPLTIVLLLGYTRVSREFKNIMSFFTHYLIAKQINDDAHDWEEDLKKGHNTPVVALLLKRALDKKIIKKQRNLRELFWKEIIQEVSLLIYDHAKKAKTALKKSTIIADQTFFNSLIDAQTHSADLALEEQKNMTEFIKIYTR